MRNSAETWEAGRESAPLYKEGFIGEKDEHLMQHWSGRIGHYMHHVEEVLVEDVA